MLATACYDHLVTCAMADMTGDDVWPDNHVILAGKSGTGKSAMLKVLGRYLGIPVVEIDCSNLSPAGYRGINLTHVYNDLEERLVESGLTRPAVLIWEEIDKLRSTVDEAGRYREMIQVDSLRFLDGALCGSDGTLDPTRILCIGCGAFGGIDQIRNPDLVSRIGFNSARNPSHGSGQYTPPSLDPEHLVKFGLITEFVGRFSRFALLDPIDHTVMRRIITESESSVYRRKVEQFRLHGVRLSFDEGALNAVADLTMKHPVGARGLRLILSRALAPWEFQLPHLAEQGVTEIIFNEAAVLGLKEPEIVRASSEEGNSIPLLEARRKAASKSPSQRDEGDDLCLF